MISLRKAIIVFLSFSFSGYVQAQITYINGHQLVYEPGKTSREAGDSMLNLFVFTAQFQQHFTIIDDDGKNEISPDSLYPKIKKYIDNFVVNNPHDVPEDIEFNNGAVVVSVYEKVKTLKHGSLKNINPKELEDILNSINALPYFKEKIWLSLKYFNVFLPILVNPAQVQEVCDKVKQQADSIEDSFEKGYAFMYIGDFAREHHLKAFSFSSYYTAKGYFYRSSKTDKEKLHVQGVLSEKMAKIFEFTGRIKGAEKRRDYYISASQYFDNAKDNLRANENLGRYFVTEASLLSDDNYKNWDSTIRIKEETDLIKSLNNNYVVFLKEHKNHNHPWEYSLQRAVGTLLENRNKNEAAKTFYFMSLLEVLQGNDINALINLLGDLSGIYAKLDNEDLAIKYADLQIAIAKKTGNLIYYYEGLIEKADAYFVLKKYDSALVYSKDKFWQMSAHTMYELLDATEIQEHAFLISAAAFSALQSDSVNNYSLLYERSHSRHLEEFQDLLMAESVAEKWFLEVVKDDGLSNEKAITNYEYTKNVVYLTIVMLLVLLFVVGWFFIRSNNKRKQLEADGFRMEEEQKRINAENENAQNKLSLFIDQGKHHEIRSLVEQIAGIAELKLRNIDNPAVFGSTGTKEYLNEIVDFSTAVSNYVSKHYETSQSPLSTMNNEIKLSQAFLEVYKQEENLSDNVIQIINEITDDFVLNQLPVPSLLLNNFIMNAIQYGLGRGEIKRMNIFIRCFKTSNGFTIEVEDDGCGINYSKKNNRKRERKSTGTEWVNKVLDVYNFSNNDYVIWFNNFQVSDKSDILGEHGTGTRVRIKIFKK
jgi:signal transduction histidine kinase